MTTYYIADDLWNDVCAGYAPNDTAKALADAGMLRRQGARLKVRKTFPGLGERSYRCVELTRAVRAVVTDEDNAVQSYR